MKPIPLTPEVAELARRVIWFEPPEKAVAIPQRLVAYAMTYGTFRDVEILRKHLGDDGLRQALDDAPPGIFDPRSWAYWNVKLDRFPAPPLPQRKFPSDSAAGD